MNTENSDIALIIRMNLYLARKLRKGLKGTGRMHALREVTNALRQARFLILAWPATYAACISLLPQINKLLKGCIG